MSSETTETKEQTGGKKKPLLLIAMLVGGVAAGGVAGSFVVGPLLADPPPAEAHADECDDEDGECYDEEYDEEGEHGGGEGKAAAVHTVENLVLNPSGTGGTRFLLSTVAFGVRDEATLAKMAERDAEVRDILLGVLGSKTVEELANMAARDSLKHELRTNLQKAFGRRAIKNVYFPQFVIQ